MGKFIIEKEDKEAVYLMYADEDGDVMVEGAYLTPYTEPDREKAAADAFQRGYEHAKHECEDCRKIIADAEQELADKAYRRGLNDAWEASHKVLSLPGFLSFCKIPPGDNVWNYLTPNECIEKIKAYEEGKKQEEEIKVGDEVEWMGDKYVVTYVMCEAKKADLISCTFGSACENVAFSALVKTGRHFSEISEVLKKMREE